MTNQTILNWINQNKDKKSETEMRDELLSKGWQLEEIGETLNVAFGRKKKTTKGTWIALGIFLFIIAIILIASFDGGEEKKEAKETAQEVAKEEMTEPTKKIAKEEVKKKEVKETKGFSFEDYIKADKVRKYEIAKEKDISIGKNIRMSYSIIVSADITEEELRATIAQVVKEKSTGNSDIDEIHVGAWESKESFEGGNPNLGYAEWCPQGDWAGVTSEIASQNIRDSYKIVYNIDKEALESLKEKKEEKKYGLSEEKRKEIERKLARCESRGQVEAAKYYDPMCSACLEFIEDNFYKLADKSMQIEERCKEEVREKYNITEDIQTKIVIEGLEERWPLPELQPYPECCAY